MKCCARDCELDAEGELTVTIRTLRSELLELVLPLCHDDRIKVLAATSPRALPQEDEDDPH